MISRSWIRRLERLETRMSEDSKRRIRVEIYDRSPDGTLILRPGRDNGPRDPGIIIRVTFVKTAAERLESEGQKR